MINKDVRNKLSQETVVFENPAFDNSIIGTTFDGRAIYLFDKMVEELVADDRIDEDEAREYIEYNSLRSLPFAGEYSPIVVCDY